MLHLEHCIVWLRDLDTDNIGVEVYEELLIVWLEETGENKMARETN